MEEAQHLDTEISFRFSVSTNIVVVDAAGINPTDCFQNVGGRDFANDKTLESSGVRVRNASSFWVS